MRSVQTDAQASEKQDEVGAPGAFLSKQILSKQRVDGLGGVPLGLAGEDCKPASHRAVGVALNSHELISPFTQTPLDPFTAPAPGPSTTSSATTRPRNPIRTRPAEP